MGCLRRCLRRQRWRWWTCWTSRSRRSRHHSSSLLRPAARSSCARHLRPRQALRQILLQLDRQSAAASLRAQPPFLLPVIILVAVQMLRGVSLDGILAQCSTTRPFICENKGFQRQLVELEGKLVPPAPRVAGGTSFPSSSTS